MQLNSERDVYNRKKIRRENIQNNTSMQLQEKEVQLTLQTQKDPKTKKLHWQYLGAVLKFLFIYTKMMFDTPF